MVSGVHPLAKHKKAEPINDGFCFLGAPAEIRTPDTLLKRQVLCLLSYWGKSNSFSRLEAQHSGFKLERKNNTAGALPTELLGQIKFFSSIQSLGFELKRKRKGGQAQLSSHLTEAERAELPLTQWLGWRDSNPLYRSQSPVCYHYTTSQYL